MKMRNITTVLGLSAATCLTAIAVAASWPIGVYAVVDKVVLEPHDAEPQRVQIWGAFALWDETGATFRAPQRGYLYYHCSKEQLRVCQNEWADLKSVAGTGQVVGFGSRSRASGRIRRAGAQASAPQLYPIEFGVVRMGGSPRGTVFDQLRALARAW
jgi:hypothetical protein